jgi:hypothetical protein
VLFHWNSSCKFLNSCIKLNTNHTDQFYVRAKYNQYLVCFYGATDVRGLHSPQTLLCRGHESKNYEHFLSLLCIIVRRARNVCTHFKRMHDIQKQNIYTWFSSARNNLYNSKNWHSIDSSTRMFLIFRRTYLRHLIKRLQESWWCTTTWKCIHDDF